MDTKQNLKETLKIVSDAKTMVSLINTRAEIVEGTFQGTSFEEAFSDICKFGQVNKISTYELNRA